jgi:tetratricopeptide (TPR) repeat protein
MKKTIGLTASLLLVAMAGLLAAQTPDEEYLKAMQMKDPCQQAQALDSYITNFAGKGGQYDNYAYAYYCLSACTSKSVDKAVSYGEKALAMPGTDNETKLKIYFTIPQLYAAAGQMDKAKAAAQKIIDLGKASSDPATKTKLQASGYVLIGQFAEKAGDYGAAANAYITAYGVVKDPGIKNLLDGLANTLYKSQRYADAEKVFRQFYAADQGPESAALLGQTLYKEGKIDEALAVYKEAYARKRTAALAQNIAIILNKEVKTRPALKSEAINAFIEAAILIPSQQKIYLDAAKSLYINDSPDLTAINDKIKEHNAAIEQLTKTYNEKFGDKSVDELSASDKNTMQKLKEAIAAEQEANAQLEGQLKGVLDKFNQLVAQVRSKLGR